MNILVVDDHKLIFDGLKAGASAGSGAELTFRYTPCVSAARKALAEEKFSACVLDLTLGEESGLTLLGDISRDLPVFILTMHRSLRTMNTARKLGAKGYFLKDESMDLLYQALSRPDLPEFRHSPGLENPSSPGDAPLDEPGAEPFERLSLREKQVFVLLAEGANYKEIAYRLGISPKTVNVHRQNIFKKMEIANLVDLVRLAYAMHLLPA